MTTRRTAVVLPVLLLLGFGLRQTGLGNWSYWLDEAIQVSFVQTSLSDMLRQVRTDGVHPPLDYIVTWITFHAGHGNERLMRCAPALWMSLAALMMFLAAGAWRRPVKATATAAFWVFTPLSVYLGQEIRPYALALFLIAAAHAVFGGDRRSIATYALGGACSFLACMTLYLSVLPLGVLWIFVVRSDHQATGWARASRAGILALPSLVALGAWFWTVRGTLLHASERFPTDLTASRVITLANGFFGWREESAAFNVGSLLPAALALIGALHLFRKGEVRDLFSFAATTVGVILLLVLSHHWINLRYLSLALIPASLMFGEGVEALWRLRPALAMLGLVAFLLAHVPALLENARAARPDWRQVVAYLSFQRQQGKGGPIWCLDDWSYLCLRGQLLSGSDLQGFLSSKKALLGAVAGSGWLIRTPHFRSTVDYGQLVGETRAWGTFPEAEGTLVFRFEGGEVIRP